MSTLSLENILQEAFEAKVDSPLYSEKEKAFEQFKSLGFPTTKDEEWKYTNLRSIVNTPFTIQESEQNNFTPIPGVDRTIEVVFVNGKYNEALSTIPSIDGLEIMSFAQAIENSSLATKKFSQYADSDKSSFTALNTAFSEDGVFIHVTKGKAIETPIVLYFIADSTQGDTLVQPRNLFFIEENVQVCIVEKHQGVGENASFTNLVTEIVCEKHSNTDYYKIQDGGVKANQIDTTQVEQSENSIFSATTLTFSGDIIRNDLNIVSKGEHTESFLNGIYMPKGKTHIDNHTLVDHTAPNCYSDEMYKGILADNARAVFNGKVFVRQAAQKTNAFQSNKNILLSDNATINTKPQLEIWADDVKCSHGATTGQLDKEALFYLKTKGIGEDKAKGLLLNAFVGEVLERVKYEPISEYAKELILERLV